MGSNDGAETCDLVGLYLLSQLQDLGLDIGLYRDDGLALSKFSRRKNEQIKKKICEIFERNGLKITITANLKVVDFLDVTLDLNLGTYRPFLKPNDKPQYVHKDSNHPPGVKKNIAEAINERLSTISSNEDLFNEAAPIYQNALKESGYDYKLKFNPPDENTSNKKRQRTRNCIWFNPPYSMNVSESVAHKFLKALDKHFDKSNPLHKILNRHTVKVSYRTTPNMKKIISGHNAKIQTKPTELLTDKNCNCQSKKKCPLDGNCLETNVVYQATVIETKTQQTETYIGLTAPPFKQRFNNHTKSFNLRTYETDTELSKYIWKLKDGGIKYIIKWKIIDRGRSFNPVSKTCQLCTNEKLYLLRRPKLCSLNAHNELGSYCRHQKSLLHSNPKKSKT